MKNFSQLITEPNTQEKSNTNEVVGILLTSAYLAFCCVSFLKPAARGIGSFFSSLFGNDDKDKNKDKDKDKGKDKDKDKGKDKDEDKGKDKDEGSKSSEKNDDNSSKNREAFNSMLMIAKEANQNEKDKNAKDKNESLLKLIIASSFDKDGNEVPLDQIADKMKDSMSEEQFEAFKKDMTDTYEKNKDNQEFKDALVKAKENIKPEDYDKMLEDAKKEAKDTLEQLDKEKKEIEEHEKKIAEIEKKVEETEDEDKIEELKKELENLKNNPPKTLASEATGISSTGTQTGGGEDDASKEGKDSDDKKDEKGDQESAKKPEDYSNEDIEKMQDEISDLDPEKDKDKIKEKEDLLKSIAKAKDKSEDELLPKVEKGSDGKQYQKKTGPMGGKYYRVKGDDGWGPWNSGEPANESLKNYLLKMLMS